NKAEALAAQFAAYGNVGASGFAALEGPFDWIINATSASLQGDLPPLPAGTVAAQSWCYDLMYGNEPTTFCSWAQEQGAHKVLDGLGMLVEQAAEAFWLWRGVRPETAPVLRLLRAG
ncbi:MAG: shikimate dehydrogenase, partial [Rhodanobacter sp.]